MRFPALFAIILFPVLYSMSASAQISITTIGATDAAECYQNAQSDFESDTDPCDAALKDRNTTRRDKMKTRVNRGIIHNRNGDLAAARADFNAAIDMDSALAEAYLNRGNSQFLAGHHDAALADYQKSLALDVSKPWAAWYNIGLVYDVKKDAAKARDAYEKALDLNPNFTLARQKLEER